MKILAAKVRDVRYKIELDGVILHVDTEFESKNLIFDITVRNQENEKIDLGRDAKKRIYDFLQENCYNYDVWGLI